MSRVLNYREFVPPEALRRHVRRVWHLVLDAGSGHVETVYPDGCCELIAHRKSPMHALGDQAGWRQQERCVFAAQQRSAIRLVARGDVDCIGVRLQPAASSLLFKASLAGLRDRIVDLAGLDADFAMRFLEAASQAAVETAVADLSELLERRLLPLQIDDRIEHAVGQLEACDGAGPVKPIIAASGMSPRSFQSTFREQVGLSAKEFARILRLQATIRMLDDGARSMAQLAVESGFADQAHATREVRRVTGTTPARLREALRRDRSMDSSVRLAAAFVRGRLR
ncbi:MAG: helix-turn-helix domain-containing protein [Woeseia sp.]